VEQETLAIPHVAKKQSHWSF